MVCFNTITLQNSYCQHISLCGPVQSESRKFLIALICVRSNSALALLQNQAAFAECQADFSAPELPRENLQDEPPAEDSFERWVWSGCVLSAPESDWENFLAEQAQMEEAASAYAHGSATLADDTKVEEKHVFFLPFSQTFFNKDIVYLLLFPAGLTRGVATALAAGVSAKGMASSGRLSPTMAG